MCSKQTSFRKTMRSLFPLPRILHSWLWKLISLLSTPTSSDTRQPVESKNSTIALSLSFPQLFFIFSISTLLNGFRISFLHFIFPRLAVGFFSINPSLNQKRLMYSAVTAAPVLRSCQTQDSLLNSPLQPA